MKTKSLVLSLLLAVTLSGSLMAEGKPSSAKVAPLRNTSGGGGDFRVGVGFSTWGTGLVGASAVNVLQQPGLSAWIDFTSRFSLQVLGSINSSSPFTFGLGTVFRATLQGSQASGFHGGLGIAIGTAGAGGAGGTPFFMDIFPVMGFHFSLGGALDNLQLSFDGGPVFHVTPAPFQFTMVPMSLMGGVSIHWFF